MLGSSEAESLAPEDLVQQYRAAEHERYIAEEAAYKAREGTQEKMRQLQKMGESLRKRMDLEIQLEDLPQTGINYLQQAKNLTLVDIRAGLAGRQFSEQIPAPPPTEVIIELPEADIIPAPPEANLNYNQITAEELNNSPLLLLGRYYQNLNLAKNNLEHVQGHYAHGQRNYLSKNMVVATRAIEELRQGNIQPALDLVNTKFHSISNGELAISLSEVINSIKKIGYPKLETQITKEINQLMAHFDYEVQNSAQKLKDYFPAGITLTTDLRSTLENIQTRMKDLTKVLEKDRQLSRKQ